MPGVALGLIVALFLGCTNILATLAARRLGSMRAVLQAQIYGLLALLCFEGFATWYWHLSLTPSALISSIVISIFSGLCAALGNFSFYRALTIGPVALVSPLLATSAIVTVLLSFLFLHENLQAVQILCVTAVILGIMLASIDKLEIVKRAGTAVFSKGLLWALLATVAFGTMDFGIGASVAVSNWFLPLLWTRLFSLCFLALLWWGRQNGVVPRTETMQAITIAGKDVPIQRKKAVLASPLEHPEKDVSPSPDEVVQLSSLDVPSVTTPIPDHFEEDDEVTLPRIKKIAPTIIELSDADITIPDDQFLSLSRAVTHSRIRVVQVKKTPVRYALLVVIFAGILENVAILLFSFDTGIATTGIASAIASSYVLMVMLFGVLFYREHLAKHQWGGILLFMVGVVLLALYR